MKRTLLVSLVGVLALMYGDASAAPRVKKPVVEVTPTATEPTATPTVIEVFDPFLLTTVTETVTTPTAVTSSEPVAVAETTSTITVKPVGTPKPVAPSEPIATLDQTIQAQPVINPNHHKPGHKSKKKPHPVFPPGPNP